AWGKTGKEGHGPVRLSSRDWCVPLTRLPPAGTAWQGSVGEDREGGSWACQAVEPGLVRPSHSSPSGRDGLARERGGRQGRRVMGLSGCRAGIGASLSLVSLRPGRPGKGAWGKTGKEGHGPVRLSSRDWCVPLTRLPPAGT